MQGLSQKRVSPEALKTFCIEALLRAGMSESPARVTAEVLVTTDTWGIHTHGTYNLFNYVRKIRAGGIAPRAVPEITADGPCWASLDGHCAIAMVTSCMAMETAISKAKSTGIGFAGVRNSNHFGAAAYYASMALQHEMIGLAFTNTGLAMTAPGSRGAVIGNNPLAYAAPAGEERPLLMDIALSVVAGTKVEIAKKLGKPIPDNWIVDEAGLPTTDPGKYPSAVSLVSMAAHKGYGLALMVEILAGVLTGAGVTTGVVSWGPNLPAPPHTGHSFIAIDVSAMMPLQQFKMRMDTMIRGIRESPKAAGAERIYLPGEMEWEKRDQALKLGLLLPAETITNLSSLAKDVGLRLTDYGLEFD